MIVVIIAMIAGLYVWWRIAGYEIDRELHEALKYPPLPHRQQS